MSTETPDLDPEVYKVIGAPGTGKTTRVVGNPELPDVRSLVMENLEEYDFEDQMIVTYTKAGTEEAADRLSQIIDQPKYKIEDRVRTIHSMCYELAGVDQDQVIQWWHKKNFCDAHDLEWGGSDDDDDIMGGDTAEGNLFFNIYGWLQSNCKDVEQWEECPQEWTGSWNFTYLADRWESWKEDKDLISFSDMIHKVCDMCRKQVENLGYGMLFPDEDDTHEEVFKAAREDDQRKPEVLRGKGGFVDTKVLYVDEVQDLTPLQWRWYLAQKLVCEKVYIGGDDDQTIYGWAGANPDFMLGEEGDFEVLDKTYRIPANIWEKCDESIQQVDQRQEKEVTPHGDGGEFITHIRPEPSKVAKYAEEGEVFFLFRARYMIDEFTKSLRKAGIPYDNMSTFDTWDNKLRKLRDACSKLYNKEGKLRGDELEAIKDRGGEGVTVDMDGMNARNTAMANLTGIPVQDALDRISINDGYRNSRFTVENFLDSAEEVNYYQKQAIMGNIEAGREDWDSSRVRIGTIHSAKGKEAETVVLALDSTKTILSNMADETMEEPGKSISDAERRVYYVGMTRASERLVLAEGVVNNDTTLRIEELIPSIDRRQARTGNMPGRQQSLR